MGKTYGYNPKEEAVTNRPSWERLDGECDFEEHAPKPKKRKRRSRQQDFRGPVTPEQAMEMMRDRIDTALSNLMGRRIVPPSEKEDYTQILNVQICRMLPFYSPERTGWNERAASLRRYLNVVVDSAVADIVRHCMANKSQILASAVPVQEADDDEEDEDGISASLPCLLNPYRESRRHMENLWLRMDLEVLSAMLTEEERMTLAMRFQGYTYPEIVDALNSRLQLGVDRFHVMNVTMAGIRRAAIKCGFEASERPRKAGKENS